MRDKIAARRLENSLLRNIRFTNLIVDLHRFAGPAFSQESLGTEHAALGDSRTDFRGRPGQRISQHLGRGQIADLPQGHGGGRSDFGVLVGQAAGQEIDGGRIAADADRIDRADQQVALQRISRLAQRFVGFGAGNRFQCDAGPRGQLFIGEEPREIDDCIAGAINRELLAGAGLVGARRVRAQDRNELGFFFRIGALRVHLTG